jgi:hypothetical protein
MEAERRLVVITWLLLLVSVGICSCKGIKESCKWYPSDSPIAATMKEPYLCDRQCGEAYRFIYMRTFHEPITIRLEIKPDGSGILTAKMTDGKSGYEFGKLIENKTIQVEKSQVDKFLYLLKEEAGFWDMPTEGGATGFDGANWTIEGVDGGRYHRVERWSPDMSDWSPRLIIFEEAAVMMFELSGLKVNEIY